MLKVDRNFIPLIFLTPFKEIMFSPILKVEWNLTKFSYSLTLEMNKN